MTTIPNKSDIKSINQQSKYWCFTINNPTVDDYQSMAQLNDNESYKVWQTERGHSDPKTKKEGTLHIQAYVELTLKRRRKAIAKVYPRADISIRIASSKQASDYCLKEDTRVSSGKTLGTLSDSTPGRRTDLTTMQQDIKTMSKVAYISANPQMYARCRHSIDVLYEQQYQNTKRLPPTVTVIYGPPGSGKTRTIYDKHDQTTIYKVAKSNNKDSIWFNGYDPGQHKVLLIDDFYGWISYSFLLQLLDRYPMKVEVKGSMTNILVTDIYITSNVHPEEWYNYTDRGMDYRAISRRINTITYLGPPSIDTHMKIKRKYVPTSPDQSTDLDKGVSNLKPYIQDTRKESKYHPDFD